MKLINTNRVRVGKMRARVAAGGPALTRWETRFVQTYKQDALKYVYIRTSRTSPSHRFSRRLIPFALIIIIAEEAIPLVVLWAPFLLPSTCVLPAQKERIAAKKRAGQQIIAETSKGIFEDVLRRASAQKDLQTLLGSGDARAISGCVPRAFRCPIGRH